jgi:hypothetical protein
MKKLIFIAAAALMACGCSSIQQTAATSGAGTNLVRQTTLRVRTLGDAKQLVAQLRASNGATHNLGAQGIDQQSTSQALESAIGAAVRAAIGASNPNPAK